jgi:hypothetical protein
MKASPRSPPELTQALVAIFPSLPRDFGVSGESVFDHAGPTYQSVIRDFAYFFGKNIEIFSDRQLRRFAELVTQSVSQGGDLGNAMDTCFLQQMDQLRVRDRIAPFLATAEKQRAK